MKLGDEEGAAGSHPRVPIGLAWRSVAQLSQNSLVPWADDEDPVSGESEQGFHLLEYWRVLFKHKWWIAGSVAVALVVGIADTLLTRPVYTASSTIEIDRSMADVIGLQNANVNSLNDLSGDAEFYETQYGLLKSRALAERVAQSLGLAADSRFLVATGLRPSSAANVSDRLDRVKMVVGVLQGGLTISPVINSRLVTITFDSPNPSLSARVANAFADNFMASNLERRFEASSYARTFLEEHLAKLKVKLEDSERQLVAYAMKQHIIQIEATGAVQTRDGSAIESSATPSLAANDLTAFDAALTAAKANLIQAKERWLAARSTASLAIPEVLADPTITTLRQQRATLEAQYENDLKIYKPDYPNMVEQKARIDDIDKQLASAANTIVASLKTQYETALQQQNALQGQVDATSNSVLDLDNREIELHILQREVDTNRTLYEGLLQRYKEIGVAGAVATNNASIVDRAEPPESPSRPRPIRNMTIAGFAGLGIGIMLAFLLEALDQAIRTPRDVEEKLGVPVLGSVPILAKGLQPREALADIRSAFSESYFSIRSVLGFTTKDGAPRTLAITSAGPMEGKTTSAMALAQGFARIGRRVLLVDLDLRNPALHKTLGADNRIGVSNVLTGSMSLEDVMQPTEWPDLAVVPSGPLPPSPPELLASQRLYALIDEAQAGLDMVIMDSPPVMGLADAPLLASAAMGTILIVEAGRTSRAQARAAIRRLRTANVHLLGVILTKFDPQKAAYGYGYGYGYAYEYDYDYGRKHKSAGQATTLLAESKERKPPSAA